jgi:DNA-directed RNA polymerase specialized sigma24 family protein
LSYQETAEFLGIERVTIGTRLHRARQMLKRLLDNDGMT